MSYFRIRKRLKSILPNANLRRKVLGPSLPQERLTLGIHDTANWWTYVSSFLCGLVAHKKGMYVHIFQLKVRFNRMSHNYLLFIGIAYLFIDGLDRKWTPSQGQFSPKLRCASFCLLTELFMLPFGQLPLPNTPQQVFFLRTTDVVVQSCKTQNILSAQ